MLIKVTTELEEDIKQAAILTGGGKQIFISQGHIISDRANFLFYSLTEDGLAMVNAITQAVAMQVAAQMREECARKARSIGFPHVADAILFEPIDIKGEIA